MTRSMPDQKKSHVETRLLAVEAFPFRLYSRSFRMLLKGIEVENGKCNGMNGRSVFGIVERG